MDLRAAAAAVLQYGGAGGIRVQDDYAYVAFDGATNNGGVAVIDISNEAAPFVAARVYVAQAGGMDWRGTGFDLQDDRIVFNAQNRVVLIDVADPTNPVTVDEYSTPAAFGTTRGGDVQIVGDMAYASVYDFGQGGLAIYRLPPSLDPLGDEDADGVLNGVDNCPFDQNPDQIQSDGDPLGDACDNCPGVDNAKQTDSDKDGVGNACDACAADPANDADGDGVCGDVDDCPGGYDPAQTDSDGSGVGDACNEASDPDGDEIESYHDICPLTDDPAQTDTDNNGIGDACNDANDPDGDEFEDGLDICPLTYDPEQVDTDDNGIGDACNDANDPDGDEIEGDLDNCPAVYNPDQEDSEPVDEEPTGADRSVLADNQCVNGSSLVSSPTFRGDYVCRSNGNDNSWVGGVPIGTCAGCYRYLTFALYPMNANADLLLQVNCGGWNHRWGYSAGGQFSGFDWFRYGQTLNVPAGQWTVFRVDLVNDVRCGDGSAIGEIAFSSDNGDAYYDAVWATNSPSLLQSAFGDGYGDACDTCPLDALASQQDTDGDGVGDACDNCELPNPDQADLNGNGLGDACEDQPPTADAGDNQSLRAGDIVALDGSRSYDDNTATAQLLYSWTLTDVPYGSAAFLDGADTPTPNLFADAVGTYTVQLTVTDEMGQSDVDEVVISSENMAPTAAAGADTLVVVGAAVQLDGSLSQDPEGDALSWAWTLAAPAGSAASLIGANTSAPVLVPDLPGTYVVTLVVADFIGPGEADSVSVIAATAEGYAEIRLVQSFEAIASLPQDAVTSGGNQSALGNFLTQGIAALQDGDLALATKKLTTAIERVDGCQKDRTPREADTNKNSLGWDRDWITDCAVQGEAWGILMDALEALAP